MQPAKLRVDPRKVVSFADVAVPPGVLARLPFAGPLPIQKKMLALHASGVSMLARSSPNTGKSTSAVLSIVKALQKSEPPARRGALANLVLVPTPELAEQYCRQMLRYLPEASAATAQAAIQALYRNGRDRDAADEAQHQQLLAKSRRGTLSTVVATPARVLDYLSTDPKWRDWFGRIEHLAVDELDSFQHADPDKTTPLETLLEYVFSLNKLNKNAPLLTLMANKVSGTLQFAKLPGLLDEQAATRYIYDVSENSSNWDGNVVLYDRNGAVLDSEADAEALSKVRSAAFQPDRVAALLKRVWHGEGLVVVPANQMSPSGLQSSLAEIGVHAPVVRMNEISGLHFENIGKLYVVTETFTERVSHLPWMLQGDQKAVYVLNLSLVKRT